LKLLLQVSLFIEQPNGTGASKYIKKADWNRPIRSFCNDPP